VTQKHLSIKYCFVQCAYGHRTYNETKLKVSVNGKEVASLYEIVDNSEVFPVKKLNGTFSLVSQGTNESNGITVVKCRGSMIRNWKKNHFELDKIVFAPVSKILPFEHVFHNRQYHTMVTNEWKKLINENIHVFTDPVPATDDQLRDLHLIRAIADVVPAKESLLFKELNRTFSLAYVDFLVDAKVEEIDTKILDLDIEEMQLKIEDAGTQLLRVTDECFTEFKEYADKQGIKPVLSEIQLYLEKPERCPQLKILEKKIEDLKLEKEALLKKDTTSWFYESLGKTSITMAKAWHYELDKLESIHNETNPTPASFSLKSKSNLLRDKYFGTSSNNDGTSVELKFGTWVTIPVRPSDTWYNQQVLDFFNEYPTKTKTNYFKSGGILESKITNILVANNVTATFTVTNENKEVFLIRYKLFGMRPIVLGPFVFDQVEIKSEGTGKPSVFTLKASGVQPFALTSNSTLSPKNK
jgi:hypothetical protein